MFSVCFSFYFLFYFLFILCYAGLENKQNIPSKAYALHNENLQGVSDMILDDDEENAVDTRPLAARPSGYTWDPAKNTREYCEAESKKQRERWNKTWNRGI